MQMQRGEVFPMVTTFWAFMFRHYLITRVYVSTGDLTCSGMQQQLSFSKDESEENARWEKSIPTDNLSVTECLAAAGMWHSSSQSCCCHTILHATGGTQSPWGLWLKAYSCCCKNSGTAVRGARDKVHWMLRLRYCRNMLASWGKFSSLGCILV